MARARAHDQALLPSLDAKGEKQDHQDPAQPPASTAPYLLPLPPLSFRNHQALLLSLALLLTPSLYVTSPTNPPTPATPSSRTKTGRRTAHSRGGKAEWRGWVEGRKGCRETKTRGKGRRRCELSAFVSLDWKTSLFSLRSPPRDRELRLEEVESRLTIKRAQEV